MTRWQTPGGASAAQARTLAALPTPWKTPSLPARRRLAIARPGRRWASTRSLPTRLA